MTYYLQVNEEGIITDAINYAYGDYVPVEIDANPLPTGINGGWWKLENGVPVEYPELRPIEEAPSNSNDVLRDAVRQGVITTEQYAAIVGETYE